MTCSDGAETRNIELVTMSTDFFNQQKDRISQLIKSDGKDAMSLSKENDEKKRKEN